MGRPLGRKKPESEGEQRDQRDQPAPAKGSPPPPFIVIRRGGVHEWEYGSRRFPLKRGGTVVGHCRKYTVGHGGGRRSCPGYRPWFCEDRAGRPASPCRWRGCRWCMVFYIRRSGVQWALRTRVLHAPAEAVAVAGRAAAPNPLVGVRACTLGGPGDMWRSRTPRGGRSGTPSVCAERPSLKDT